MALNNIFIYLCIIFFLKFYYNLSNNLLVAIPQLFYGLTVTLIQLIYYLIIIIIKVIDYIFASIIRLFALLIQSLVGLRWNIIKSSNKDDIIIFNNFGSFNIFIFIITVGFIILFYKIYLYNLSQPQQQQRHRREQPPTVGGGGVLNAGGGVYNADVGLMRRRSQKNNDNNNNNNNNNNNVEPYTTTKVDGKYFINTNSPRSHTHNVYKEKECSICWVEYKKSDILRTLRCGHTYHPHCVDDFIKTHPCPLCQIPSESKGWLIRSSS